MSRITFKTDTLVETTTVPEDEPGTYTVRIGITHRVLGTITEHPSGYIAKANGTDYSRTHIESLDVAAREVVHMSLMRGAISSIEHRERMARA